MSWNLSISITARADRSVTRYERGRGRSYISISEDRGWYVVGASGSELGPLVQERFRTKEDPEKVGTLEW